VEIEKKLQSLELGLTDTLILDLLSNTAYSYMGTDDDGLSTSAVTDRGKNREKDKKGTWTRARTRTRKGQGQGHGIRKVFSRTHTGQLPLKRRMDNL
jgi:hypothetical protein